MYLQRVSCAIIGNSSFFFVASCIRFVIWLKNNLLVNGLPYSYGMANCDHQLLQKHCLHYILIKQSTIVVTLLVQNTYRYLDIAWFPPMLYDIWQQQLDSCCAQLKYMKPLQQQAFFLLSSFFFHFFFLINIFNWWMSYINLVIVHVVWLCNHCKKHFWIGRSISLNECFANISFFCKLVIYYVYTILQNQYHTSIADFLHRILEIEKSWNINCQKFPHHATCSENLLSKTSVKLFKHLMVVVVVLFVSIINGMYHRLFLYLTFMTQVQKEYVDYAIQIMMMISIIFW